MASIPFNEQTPGSVAPSGLARTWLSGCLILLAAVAAYSNSFSGPFIFDDPASITDNLTIRHLWPLGPVLSPPSGGVTVEGRPVVNLSLAINYAISGNRVWSYHAFNLAIHILSALALFGIVGRTLARRNFPGARGFALAVALLWSVHPLQTEAVTYVVQRAESLMGLFYFLTLYAFIRGSEVEGRNSFGWLVLSWGACLFGMATKEVMVSAPVMVFIYDGVFGGGAWSQVWNRRKGYWLALGGTWILLGYFVLSAHNRGGTFRLYDGPAAMDLLDYAVSCHCEVSLAVGLAASARL